MNSLERVFTNHLKFFNLILVGGSGAEIYSIFVSGNIFSFFPLLTKCGLSTPLLLVQALCPPWQQLMPQKYFHHLKGKIPYFPEVTWASYPDLPVLTLLLKQCFQKSNPGCCLRPANRGNFSFQIYLSKLMYVSIVTCSSTRLAFQSFTYGMVIFLQCFLNGADMK